MLSLWIRYRLLRTAKKRQGCSKNGIKLKEIIPQQMFEVAIQGSISAKIICEDIRALRKNVTANVMVAILAENENFLKSRKRVRRK